jgi:hypothetical protein
MAAVDGATMVSVHYYEQTQEEVSSEEEEMNLLAGFEEKLLI